LKQKQSTRGPTRIVESGEGGRNIKRPEKSRNTSSDVREKKRKKTITSSELGEAGEANAKAQSSKGYLRPEKRTPEGGGALGGGFQSERAKLVHPLKTGGLEVPKRTGT